MQCVRLVVVCAIILMGSSLQVNANQHALDFDGSDDWATIPHISAYEFVIGFAFTSRKSFSRIISALPAEQDDSVVRDRGRK